MWREHFALNAIPIIHRKGDEMYPPVIRWSVVTSCSEEGGAPREVNPNQDGTLWNIDPKIKKHQVDDTLVSSSLY